MSVKNGILHQRFVANYYRLLKASAYRNTNRLALAAMMQPGDIYRMLKGKHLPRLDMVERLAALLGIDPNEFFQP